MTSIPKILCGSGEATTRRIILGLCSDGDGYLVARNDAVRVLSDELWEQIKDGRLTGFSIGGSARRVPEEEQAGKRRAA